MLDVAKGCGSEGEDWRADLGIGDDLDAEDVCKPWAAIISKGTENEIFAFLIKDKDSG